MIKNYIFDFGNVICEYSPYNLAAVYATGDDIKIISDVVFDRTHWLKLDCGTITDGEVRNIISKRLSGNLLKTALDVFDNWVYNLKPIDGAKKIIEDIKKSGAGLYILSNIGTTFAKEYKKVSYINEVFSMFDGFVFSGEVKMLKPDGEIFEHLLNKFNLKASECLFIDDGVKNVETAKNMGMEGLVFDGDWDKARKLLGF